MSLERTGSWKLKMKLFALCLLTLAGILTQAPQTQGAKILATFAFPGRSQYIFAEAYLKALAARGHEVTVITTSKTKPTPNMRFIVAPKIHDLFDGKWERLSKCLDEQIDRNLFFI